MKFSKNPAINALLILVLSLWMGLAISCTCSFCDVAEAQIASSAPLPAANYEDAITTVGTALTVVPSRTGAPITSATVSAGTLPPGMALQPNGSISGTPTQAGVYPLQIQLCSGSQCIIRPVVITVNTAAADPINAQYTDASTIVGTPLTVPPTLISGGPATSAVLAQGSLPPGMTLNAITGVVSGTPTTAGVFPLTINLANAAGGHVAVPVTITVSQSGSTALVAAYTDAVGPVGTALTVTPNVTAGGPVVVATLTSGSIPPGMVLNANGSISGTPTTPGTYSAEISLRNASGALTTQHVTITIYAVGATALSASYIDYITTVGSVVTVMPTVGSGGPVVGAQLATGSLPPGLTLNPNGTITGTATTSGLYTMEIRLCNASGACVTVPLKITVNNLPLTLAYGTPRTFIAGSVIAIQNATVGNALSTLTTTFTLSSGALPLGLTLNPDGTINGTPTVIGDYTFSVTATNGARTATANLLYTVLPALVATYTDASGPVGNPLTVTPSATTAGPITSATLTSAPGTIPPGMTLNAATGVISGTPTTAGTYTPTITLCNAAGSCTSQSVTITISPALVA
ncbi:MAG: Ig domain-containing protein, partial [Holophaga sp.]